MENCSGKRNGEKSYKGIRMRRWGRWEANIREPIKKSRIWLGTYSSPVAAARAYDTALYYIYGPTSRLNFPELLAGEVSSDGDIPQNMSLATIRKKALKVGARVDALEASTVANGRQEPPPSDSEMIRLQPCRLEEKPDLNNIPDLNKSPEPEDPDEDIL